MYVEQGEMFDGLISAGFTPTQVAALRGIFTQCMLNHVSRGTLSLHGGLPEGATGAVLSLANFPPTGEITNSDVPDGEGEMRNGWALDVIFGAVRFGGAVVFDGDVVDNGGTLATLPVGSVILWAGAIGSIPTGWALMDGTANASGSGIDMRGMVPYGYSGAGDFATIGGSIAAAFTADIQSGNPTFALTVNSAVTGITISAHAASSGGTTVSTEVDIWSVDDAPGTGLEAFDGTNADATFLSGDANDITDVGHDHNILKSNIATALADHTITEPSAGAGHTHTATIDADGFADELNIATPTVVRTPGVVLAYIEKIA